MPISTSFHYSLRPPGKETERKKKKGGKTVGFIFQKSQTIDFYYVIVSFCFLFLCKDGISSKNVVPYGRSRKKVFRDFRTTALFLKL